MNTIHNPDLPNMRHICIHNQQIPVTMTSEFSNPDLMDLALNSTPFLQWRDKVRQNLEWLEEQDENEVDRNKLQIHGIEIQNVDLFGRNRVGFVKMRVDCTKDGVSLPGICFLRGASVGILVCLKVMNDTSIGGPKKKQQVISDSYEQYTILVEQTRVPIGCESMLELPAGMLDENGSFVSQAAAELREECDIHINEDELFDLTEHTYGDGVIPSGGGCDERVRLYYLEKEITKIELERMDGKLLGLREHGEIITLRIIKMSDAWKLSKDMKVLCALQLLQQIKTDLPMLLTQRKKLSQAEPLLKLSDGNYIPQLAFGLYNVRPEECEEVVINAIKAGYRHFDCASIYGNEAAVGRALIRSGVPRNELFICSKVWNDAQKDGHRGVRSSFERSLNDLKCEYIDLYLVHWPVPGHHISTYKTLEKLHKEGKVKSIGLSNYTPTEYEELVEAGITISPVINQIEVSPYMYRPDLIRYFFQRGIVISAFKALNRGKLTERRTVRELADTYSKTCAQIFLRWGLQKHLVVISKTSKAERMNENRNILDFDISDEDMKYLDILTNKDDVRRRSELEELRKRSM